MLVLSRKTGESIQISDNVSVTVSHVRAGRVRLSIDAPQTIRIVRKELLADDKETFKEGTVADA
ncbi:MAG: carbon storage regulator [Fuerstiella sp.]|nr:carbon storage regulator [Fuerstiella sp.]